MLQVSQPPRFGSLRRVRDQVDRFSAADLQSGLVRYDHEDLDNEGENVDDRFTFVVCVDSLCADGAVDVRMTAGGPPTSEKPTMLPTVVVGKIVVARVLGSAVITSSHLNTICARCPQPLNIIYTMVSYPRYGRLMQGSHATQNQTVTSFSQRDLDLGHVVYQHVDSAFLSDSVQLSASVRSRDNDVIWSSDVQLEIEIEPSGTEIVLSATGNISVVEGERAFITENQLSIQHGGEVDDVEIVVIRLPVYGRIQVVSGQELRARTSFLLSQVNECLRSLVSIFRECSFRVITWSLTVLLLLVVISWSL